MLLLLLLFFFLLLFVQYRLENETDTLFSYHEIMFPFLIITGLNTTL